MNKFTFPFVNRLILSFLIGGLVTFSGPAHINAAPVSDPNHERIKRIEVKLSNEKQKLKEFDSQEKNLLTELAALEKDVAEKRSAVDNLSKRLHQSEAEVGGLKRKLEDLKRSSRDVEIEVSKKLVEFYKHARVGYVRILSDIREIAQFFRRVKYLKAVMENDRKILIKAAEQAKEHHDEILRTESKLTEIRNISSEEKTRLKTLKKELEKKVLCLIKIHKEKEFYETAVLELQNAAEGLKQTIINIEKKDNDEINQSLRFEDFKGKLPYPIEGKVIRGQKFLKSGRLGTYKGIAIDGSPNSNVRAVFPGKVAFSGRLKGYGELVIINHGSRFFTVSAHLSARDKIEGDVVKGGEILGRVDGKGTVKRARLYFEIRKAGKTLDPKEWLRAK